MKITMLYFNTVAEVINQYGYTWEDVNNIQDYKGRVVMGGYKYTLADIFYSTHMGGFDQNSERGKILINSFVQALQEMKENKTHIPFHEMKEELLKDNEFKAEYAKLESRQIITARTDQNITQEELNMSEPELIEGGNKYAAK